MKQRERSAEQTDENSTMKLIHRIFAVGYGAIIFVFVCCGLALICFAAQEFWNGVNPGAPLALRDRFHAILQCIGLLTIAVVTLELSQTLLEEEILRAVKVSAPTRVRRFLSRFLVVIVVALAIETLVLAFKAGDEETARLVHVAFVGFAAAALLGGWGLFIKLNRSAEELEPEAMQKAKREDAKLE